MEFKSQFRKIGSISIRRVDPVLDDMAARVHAIQTAAYRQEALLLGVREFPPLDRTVDDVSVSSDTFFGAFAGDELVGVIVLERQSGDIVLISSLTVTPSFQRRGVARALIATAARQVSCQSMSVSTGARNHPAVSLYKGLGFAVSGRRRIGPEQLEIVEFSGERTVISRNAQGAGRT